mgnify:FL=1
MAPAAPERSGKGTVMKHYASGEELIAEIRKRADLFIAEFDDVPASGLHLLKDGVDRAPAQMLAYQLGWMDLLLGWEQDERAGRQVVTPAPDYRWNRLGGLYSSFYEQWQDAPLSRLQEAFRERVDGVVDLVGSLSPEELFTPGRRAWASSTPSSWPVAKWVHINTVAPFTSFRTKIRVWKRR